MIAHESPPRNAEPIESWRRAWRLGLAPVLPLAGLQALATALAVDDSRVMQGGTCNPPPLILLENCPVEECCPIAFCGWRGEQLETVSEVEHFFAHACWLADCAMGERDAVKVFLDHWDSGKRETVLDELLAEVERELERRNEPCRSK